MVPADKVAAIRAKAEVLAGHSLGDNGNTDLLASLPPVLLRGVPMGERTLHPLDIKTEGDALTFDLVLCVPVPPVEKPGQAEPGVMATLRLGI